MKASIVIPAYRPHQLLQNCVEAIMRTTDLNQVEIIVVCNGSEKESAEYILSLGKPFRLVWYEEALGFTRAANIGFMMARAEFVIIMNTDAILNPHEAPDHPRNWLNRMIDPFQDPKIGITGIGGMWMEYGKFVCFFCSGIRRRLFDELGYLDEAFSPGYSEDADFCFRARKAGYEILTVDTYTTDHTTHMNITDFPIYHKGEGSFTDKAKRQEYVDNGYRVLAQKWGKK